MPRPRLEHLLRLAIAVQIMIATVLLAIDSGSVLFPIATLLLLGISAYVTDLTGWFRLKQRAADYLALSIMLATAVAAVRADRYGLLITVANLQSYLQYVLFFQAKAPRVYWQLALLSLGQMAIASTLVPGPTFGVFLLAYLLAGIVAFSLLLLQRETAAMTGEPLAVDSAASKGQPKQCALVLAGGVAAVDAREILRSLVPFASAIAMLTVVGGGLLFFVLPRWNVANIEVNSTEPLRSVGFSNTVMLGELGEVVENPDVVMRIQFFRGRGNRPIRLIGEPLFHGTVVTRYENRSWTQPTRAHPVRLSTEAGSTVTRQRITCEPLDVNQVFCVAPAVAIDQPDPKLQIDLASNQLLRASEYRNQRVEFDIGTTGIAGNRQRDVVACQRLPNREQMQGLLQPFADGVENTRFAGLEALAARILAEREIDPRQDRVAAARALSDSFRSSGEFFYSLEPQTRDADVDPLEDFVTAHQVGHCEYFAGALALMLRSQGIPARVVIGFKGGVWNEWGSYYQVQQLHAHTWVEAYLSDEPTLEQEFAGEQIPKAAWLVLDPTEGIQEGDGAASGFGMLGRLRQSIDYARVLWINYVAGLNAKRQRQSFYEPLADGIEAAAAHLTSVQVWQARLDAFDKSPLGHFWQWYRRHWFSWRGGAVAVGFSFCVVGLFWTGRLLLRALFRRGWFGRRGRHETSSVLEMYRRLETALARLGLTRQPAQTAYEFAVTAGGELAERVVHRPVAHLPRRVVEAFYRVRFGGRTLDKQEAEAVEHALTRLERALSRPL